jgi:DNA-binding NarL/FixJ family response regulator
MARVLVADDSALIRDCVRRLIEAQPGWRVCGEALDGLEAVSRTAELNPDLVILDLAMPHLSGIQAAKTIRVAAPSLPLLLFTQHLLDTFLLQEARDVGFNGAISKSAENVLVLAVEALLRGEAFFQATETSTIPAAVNAPQPEVGEVPSASSSNDEPS